MTNSRVLAENPEDKTEHRGKMTSQHAVIKMFNKAERGMSFAHMAKRKPDRPVKCKTGLI